MNSFELLKYTSCENVLEFFRLMMNMTSWNWFQFNSYKSPNLGGDHATESNVQDHRGPWIFSAWPKQFAWNLTKTAISSPPQRWMFCIQTHKTPYWDGVMSFVIFNRIDACSIAEKQTFLICMHSYISHNSQKTCSPWMEFRWPCVCNFKISSIIMHNNDSLMIRVESCCTSSFIHSH